MEAILSALENRPEIKAANAKTVAIMVGSTPQWMGMGRALDTIPGMTPRTILHAGPPIPFEKMVGSMQGSIAGALIFEGLAQDFDSAMKLASSGAIHFAPCNDHSAVAPMAGIISASMPVFIVADAVHGSRAYAPINEGMGRVLQQGANDPQAIARMRYFADELGPLLADGIAKAGPLDLKSITQRALHMGDECHNRSDAATALFTVTIAPYLLEENTAAAKRALAFISGNSSFFLNLSMAACKVGLDAAMDIPHSTIVTTMARNGVDFGIKLSGTGRERWFTGPAQQIIGIYFDDYTPQDASRDMGDSAVTETMGIGGFAMAAAPAIARYIGGTAEDAINCSHRMYEITESENPAYTVPADDFRGLPLGIDALKVVRRKILPIISTAIAHKDPGIGQVGAGISTPPRSCFDDALKAFYEEYPGGEP